MNGYHGPQEKEGELDSVGKQKVGMATLIVAIMHSKLEEMTSNVNLLTFDIDKSVFFSSLNFPSIPVVILEEFLGKGLELSEGCFWKIHSAVSGERGSEAEEDKGFHEERSSRR